MQRRNKGSTSVKQVQGGPKK